LLVLPFLQVIVFFAAIIFLGSASAWVVAAADGVGVGVAIGVDSATCVNLTLSVGEEKVKPFAEKFSHPFF
jgi:hypothetical protein